jgi:hypothetical protein
MTQSRKDDAEVRTVAESLSPQDDRPTVPGFEILEELGRGGMGVVYKARQVSLNRFVALKMILAGPHAGAEQLARFRVEAEAVARVQHAGIVQIHEIGSHAGHAYLALEYVSGGTLTRKLAGARLPVMEAARLVQALARAVQYAHQRGIIHRDLKPGNVLLTEDGQPKITDFGLAKILDTASGASSDGPQTQSGAILGTPAYMAPEQAGGKRGTVGPAADVYALGAILYELLTGRPPFEADNQVDLLLKVATEEQVPPRRLEPNCPRDLETVCLKCLHKEPAARYASAAALGDDLGRFLAGEPTQARPLSLGERFRRWTWRRRWRLVGGTVAACLLLLLMVSLAFNAFAVFLVGRSQVTSTAPPEPVAESTSVKLVRAIVLPADLDLVPRDAELFATLRVADLWKRKDVQEWNRLLKGAELPNLDEPAALLENVLHLRPESIERATFVNFDEGKEILVLATTRPYKQGPRNPLQQALEKQGHKARECKDRDGAVKTYFADRANQNCVCFLNDRVLVYSYEDTDLEALFQRNSRAGLGRLRPALELAARGRSHLVAGGVPADWWQTDLLRWLDDLERTDLRLERTDLRPLKEMLVVNLTASLKPLAEGASANGLDVNLRVGYEDDAAARREVQALVKGRDFLAGLLRQFATGEKVGTPPLIARELMLALRGAKVEQRGVDNHVHLTMEWGPGWPAAAIGALKEEFQRMTSRNHLLQIGLAMQNYHMAHGHFPPAAITNKTGKPLLSWRVALLPFLEYTDLYREFRLDEAWDSEHNKKLLARMPGVYEPPLKPAGWKPGTTFYQVFVSHKTLFPPGGKHTKLNDFKGRDLAKILMAVEAAEAVPWTKPADLTYDPDRPLPRLGGIFPNGFQALFADGSARFLPANTPREKLRAMITGQP